MLSLRTQTNPGQTSVSKCHVLKKKNKRKEKQATSKKPTRFNDSIQYEAEKQSEKCLPLFNV